MLPNFFWVESEGNLLTVGDKIVKTLYSNRITSENKRIRTPPVPLHSKLGCLLFSLGSSNIGRTLHCMKGMGGENLYFLLLKSVKRKKAQLRAKCEVSQLILSPIVGLEKEKQVFTYSITRAREIRKFHVVNVQRRLINVQKRVMHVQSYCFANLQFSSDF